MKKVFGQTVRDLKREVNKKVLKVPGIEQKILDATSNEPWGPHGTHLADIALATRNLHESQIIMTVIWKRINDTGKNWRHVFKALTVLEYLVAHGSERVIDEIREHAYQISTLSDFQYIDSGGRDQGSNIRRKSQSLVALVNDKERIQEVRQKSHANNEKSRGTSSTGGAYRPSSYSGTGGYGDRYDDDRYGSRDDDRNGRERDSGYRDDDRYGRGRDSYSRDGDGRDSYKDDYRGRENDDYQFRSRSRSVDRYTDRSFDDDDRYSSQSGGNRAADHFQDERRLESKLSENNVGAPPSYEEATRDALDATHDQRDGETVAAPTHNVSSPSAPKATSPSKSTSQDPDHSENGASVAAPNKEVDAFDEFDPRGSVEAAPPAASSQEFDFFGSLPASDSTNSLALMPVTSDPTTSEADMPTNSGFGMNFSTPSTASVVLSQPYENPFGDSPFKATPHENYQAQPQNFAPVSYLQPSGSNGGSEILSSVELTMETVPSFDFGDALGGLTYTPIFENSQHSSASSSLLAPELPVVQASTNDVLDFLFPRTGSPALGSSQAAQPAAHIQAAQMNLLPHPGLAAPPVSEAASFYSQTAQPTVPTNMQTTQMNFLPHSGSPSPASEAAPVYPQAAQSAAPTNMQAAQMNLLPQSGLSCPLASGEAPVYSQAAQPVAPTNIQAVQMNLLPQSGLSAPPASEIAPVYSQAAQTVAPTNMQAAQMNFLPHSGLSAPPALEAAPVYSQAVLPATSINMQAAQSGSPANMRTTPLNIVPQPMTLDLLAPQAAPNTAGPPAKTQPSKKFEPKSTVWADTLSRGLVNLNISGPKINPLSDIGIDFDAINRREKRNEVKSSGAPVTSTITMGKAMGSGSGISRAAVSGLAPPPNPMMGSGMGMGSMGMGGGAGMGMGVGMGMGGGPGMGMGGAMGMGGYGGSMNQPPMGMGMNMGVGMGQGLPMQPPTGILPPGPGMPGAGYNPMMGMGGYGSQQPYRGGYNR